jgi:hypothetical protein
MKKLSKRSDCTVVKSPTGVTALWTSAVGQECGFADVPQANRSNWADGGKNQMLKRPLEIMARRTTIIVQKVDRSNWAGLLENANRIINSRTNNRSKRQTFSQKLYRR